MCTHTDPETFFPKGPVLTLDAKKFCMTCIVRSECLEFALEHDERFGIWGGLSNRERAHRKTLPLPLTDPPIATERNPMSTDAIVVLKGEHQVIRKAVQ